MSRVSLVLLAALVGCAKPTPVPIAPLPPDKPVPLPVAEAPKPVDPPVKPAEPERPPVPTGPVEVSLPANKLVVKLVSAGKGKRAPLRYGAKQGAKQEVQLALDWSQTQSVEGKTPAPIAMPTIVLNGQGETTQVADGVATNVLTIASTDVIGPDPKKTENFKSVLTSLAGMVITSTLAPGGSTGTTTLRIDKPNEFTADSLQLLVLTLPALPALPDQPVGVGAKWQATTAFRLAGKVEMTQVTDYEVTAHKGTSWTIKGTTKVMGVDQDVGDGTKITGIKGQGTTETTLVEGALYPTLKSTLETEFVAVDAESKLTIAQRTGASINPKTK